MKRDQNRIELNVRNGIYDEFKFTTTDTAVLLPGTIVAIVSDELESPAVASQAPDLNALEVAVVIENALVGNGINAKQYPGELLLCRRAISGDVYLLRAVPGTYYEGQPVYATQTPDGIFVSATGEGRCLGWCQESFVVTPEMVGLVDDATSDMPPTINLNGVLVNLIKVRIGNVPRAATPAPAPQMIDFTAVANGGATSSSTKITLTFATAPAADLTASEVSITPSTLVTKGAVVKVSSTVYEVAVTPIGAGSASVSITKTGIAAATKSVSIRKYVAPVVAGYWGVCYPDVRTASPSAVPTAAEIKALSSKVAITGTKRNMVVPFAMNESDWTAAGGTGRFATVAAGRAFFITTNWENASSIVSNGFNVMEAFDTFEVDIDGVAYSGYLANNDPVVYDGTEYTFTFV